MTEELRRLSTKFGSCPNNQWSKPFYYLVPKHPTANLLFRRKLVEWGSKSTENAAVLWHMCKQDMLFYINTFGYIFEPREAKRLPFITYKFQDPCLMELKEAVGDHDIVVEKSRDMGASWMCLYVLEWYWHFHKDETFLLLSRKEELVDKKGDPKELFAKVDFIHKMQPPWIRPIFRRRQMFKYNVETRSSMDGESTNKFAGVADRKKAILVDEFSRMSEQTQIFSGTRDVTFSRIFNFTPQGAANAAYKVAHNQAFKKITLHWSEHPDKSVGLYEVVDGKVVYLDLQYWTAERRSKYRFRMERPLAPRFNYRSPWYDVECDRANHPREIATELDIDYQGSDTNFFDPDILNRMKSKTKDPMHIGTMDYSLTGSREEWEAEFVTSEYGPLRMWCALDVHGRPPMYHKYTVGVDVSFGTGATNSCISVFDTKLNEQVAEWTDNRSDPFECANMAVAVCFFFYDAFLVWEGNGPGLTFQKGIENIGYNNFYYRRNTKRISQKVTEQPGWWSSPDGKSALMGDLRKAMITGSYIPRSDFMIDECRHYILLPNGGVEHRYAKESEDASGSGYNHGDTTTAAALTLLGREEVGESQTIEVEMPDHCFAARRKRWETEQKQKKRGHRFGKRFRLTV